MAVYITDQKNNLIEMEKKDVKAKTNQLKNEK